MFHQSIRDCKDGRKPLSSPFLSKPLQIFQSTKKLAIQRSLKSLHARICPQKWPALGWSAQPPWEAGEVSSGATTCKKWLEMNEGIWRYMKIYMKLQYLIRRQNVQHFNFSPHAFCGDECNYGYGSQNGVVNRSAVIRTYGTHELGIRGLFRTYWKRIL